MRKEDIEIVMLNIVRKENRFSRIEVRPVTKRQGGKLVEMLGAFWNSTRKLTHKSKKSDRLAVGTLVGTYGGTMMRREDTLPGANAPARRVKSTCLFDVSRAVTVDGAAKGNVTRYINHANSEQEANLLAHKFEVDGQIKKKNVLTPEKILY
ncbi:hypothetical protein T492DRAFT_839382 [Pavlovales sp. CCMP2436]|nr:hypothetical protein T492DRAFT_839382 [Pavlovales sp. CCMP2436]